MFASLGVLWLEPACLGLQRGWAWFKNLGCWSCHLSSGYRDNKSGIVQQSTKRWSNLYIWLGTPRCEQEHNLPRRTILHLPPFQRGGKTIQADQLINYLDLTYDSSPVPHACFISKALISQKKNKRVLPKS